MVLHLILHYGSFFGMVLFGNPEDEVSIGLHERTGPCDEFVPIRTAFGSVSDNFPTIFGMANSI